jgi:hypothetical protein
MASNDMMVVNNELGRMRNEAVVAYFKRFSQYLPGGTEKNYAIKCRCRLGRFLVRTR